MITGRDVAESFFSDLESFFYYSSGFKVKREYNQSGYHHVSVAGSGDNFRIKLSKDFCSMQVDSLDDLFFLSIMLGHECAHYLNKHNNHDDIDSLDTRAIESLADYFGARIFATVITFGKKIKFKIKFFEKEFNQKVIVSSIGKAFKKIYPIYLSNCDERYSRPIDRVMTFIAGFSSFFYRIYNKIIPDFNLWIFITILRESEILILLENNNMDSEEIPVLAERVSTIHKKIQGFNMAITVGLKPEYVPLLVTNYQLSKSESDLKKERLNEEVKKILAIINV